MKPKIIKTDADCDGALARIEEIFDARPGTPEGEELDLLTMLVDRYEDEAFPIDLPDAITAIRFRMDQQDLKAKDLIPYIGSASKVSEVLSGSRALSLTMIRNLVDGLDIPAEALVQEPGAPIPSAPRVAESPPSSPVRLRDDIRDTLYFAKMSREIWWTFVGHHPDREKILFVANTFPTFFLTTMAAHFVALVTKLCTLYDRDPRLITLARLCDRVAANPNPDGRDLEEIRTDLNTATELARRLSKNARDKLVAHRSEEMFSEDYYARAKLTYDDIGLLIERSCAIFNALSCHIDRTTDDFDLSATGDTERVLQLLAASLP